MLDQFWAEHRPTRPAFSTQYRSAIFCADDRQLAQAEASRAAQERVLGQKIYTEITRLRTFYRAEDYHQKYYLRSVHAVVAELYETFPDQRLFTDSSAVARLNGYVGGYGDASSLEAELPKLGLSRPAQEAVRDFARRRGMDFGTCPTRL